METGPTYEGQSLGKTFNYPQISRITQKILCLRNSKLLNRQVRIPALHLRGSMETGPTEISRVWEPAQKT